MIIQHQAYVRSISDQSISRTALSCLRIAQLRQLHWLKSVNQYMRELHRRSARYPNEISHFMQRFYATCFLQPWHTRLQTEVLFLHTYTGFLLRCQFLCVEH